MDPKPKAEPHASHCVVAMSGAYHHEAMSGGPHHDSMPAMVTPASVTVRIPSGGEAVSSSSEFSHEVIMLLIEAMSARWDMYGQRERSRLFQSVQQELESHGYPLPVEKIRRKWNNLIVTYKRVKERCRGRGTDRTSWEYYEAMDTVLGKAAAMGHGGSSASATLLGLAAQNSGLCDDLPPPSPGPSSGMYHSNLIGTTTQVGHLGHHQHRATPPMPMSPAPFSPVPLVNAAGMYECEEPMAVAPQRPKVNSAPSARRKFRGAGGGGRGAVAPYDRSNDGAGGGYGAGASQQQRHLLEEQRQCRQEARERRRERTANRVAESVGRMATALELLCSKQDTIIALLQRMADKH